MFQSSRVARQQDASKTSRPCAMSSFIRCACLDGCKRFLHSPLFSHPKLVTLEKTVNQERLAPHSWIFSVPTNTPFGFFVDDVLLSKMSRTTARSRGSVDSPLCRDHSAPPLLGSKHGMGPRGVRWSYADNFWVLARSQDCNNVHLARLIVGEQKAGLDVHDMSFASGSADVLGYEVSPASA